MSSYEAHLYVRLLVFFFICLIIPVAFRKNKCVGFATFPLILFGIFMACAFFEVSKNSIAITYDLFLIFSALFICKWTFPNLVQFFANSFRSITIILPCLFFLITYFCGAYIEFPSDPIEHLNRTRLWNDILSPRFITYPNTEKWEPFVYFLQNYLFYNKLGTNFHLLTLYSAFAQTLLFSACLRTSYFLSGSKKVAFSAAIISVALFGVNVFSYYRYYCFGPTFFSFILFLESIPIIFLLAKKFDFKKLLFLLAICFFCLQNHPQELLFILIWGIYAAFFFSFANKPFTKTKAITISVLTICLLGACVWAHKKLEFPHHPAIASTFIYGFEWHYLDFLHLGSRMTKALSFFGAISLFLAGLVLFSKPYSKTLKFLAFQILVTTFIFINPWSLKMILDIVKDRVDTLYRFYYSALFWLFIPYFFYEAIFTQHNHKSFRRNLLYGVIIFFVMFSCLSRRPFFSGKVDMFLERTPVDNNGRYLEGLLSYLKDNRDLNGVFLTDRYTSTMLETMTNRKTVNSRWINPRELDANHPGALKYSLTQEIEYIVRSSNESMTSWIGEESGHWPKDISYTPQYYSERFIRELNELVNEEVLTELYRDKQVQLYKKTKIVPDYAITYGAMYKKYGPNEYGSMHVLRKSNRRTIAVCSGTLFEKDEIIHFLIKNNIKYTDKLVLINCQFNNFDQFLDNMAIYSRQEHIYIEKTALTDKIKQQLESRRIPYKTYDLNQEFSLEKYPSLNFKNYKNYSDKHSEDKMFFTVEYNNDAIIYIPDENPKVAFGKDMTQDAPTFHQQLKPILSNQNIKNNIFYFFPENGHFAKAYQSRKKRFDAVQLENEIKIESNGKDFVIWPRL